MRTSSPVISKKRGKYSSVEDAVQQKQADFLTLMKGVDLTPLTRNSNVHKSFTGDNVSDVPYEEVK